MYARPTIELALTSAAESLRELLAPFHRQVPHQGLLCHEPVAMFLGGLTSVLGRFEESEGYFEEAVELNGAGGMRFAKAHTDLLWGRMLLRRDEPDDLERARALLEAAQAAATSNGYSVLAERAAVELAKLI